MDFQFQLAFQHLIVFLTMNLGFYATLVLCLPCWLSGRALYGSTTMENWK